jgi:signal transduction histidine kinase
MRLILLLVLGAGLFAGGCRRQKWASEAEEAAWWSAQVTDSAYAVLYRERTPEHALRVFDSLLAGTGQTSPFVRSGRYGLLANHHYFHTLDYAATGRYIDSALGELNSGDLHERYPRTYVGFLIFGGEMAFRLSRFAKANDYYFMAKQAADTYLNPCQRSGFLYNLGMIAYRQQNFGQSADYFRDAYRSQATCPVQTTAIVLQQQEIQSNIGLCLIRLKNYDSALLHFNSALQIADSHQDSLGAITIDRIRGVVYGNMAKVYTATGQLPIAEDLYRQSIALNARPGYEVRDALLARIQLAEVYGMRQQFPAMWTELQAARISLDTLRDTDAEAAWRKTMYAYYRDTGRPLDELRYFKSYITMRDSLADRQKDVVQADISRQLKNKEQEVEITVLRKNNQLNQTLLWASISVALLGGIIILLVYINYRRSRRNLASLTALNDEVVRQKAALERSNNEKDRILRVVAHDLRTPVGVAAYVADMILMNEHSEKDRAALEMIREAAAQALALTGELLGLPSDETESDRVATDLGALVRTSVQMLQFKAAEKGQLMDLDLPPDPLPIRGNPERLNRVFSNLLTNAIKFSPTGGHIRVGLQRDGRMALLTVSDNGIGIPAAEIGRVFDRFSTVRRAGTSGERSYGLGLSICREIVEEHGGTVTATSNDGEGTILFVRLPLTQDA